METPPNETMLVKGFDLIVENPLETVHNDLVPYHGQIFSSHDNAYEFYKSFAKAWGFSVRRQRTIGKEGDGNETTRRYYVFHRAGHLTNKEFFANKGSSKRCNCGVHMSIVKVMDSDISYWCVVTFDNLHNHDVFEPQEVRFLPAYRNISESNKHYMMRLFEIERSLKPGELPFIDKDIYNFVCAMNNANRDNDTHILLTKYKKMKDRDKDFQYDFTVSVNNHGDTCLFGCVLLRDKRVQSYSWAMKDLALKEVICKELPNTKRAFCIWHLLSKLSSWFSLLLGKRYNKFDTDFYKLYNLESNEDFEEGCHPLVNKFALHSNRHINNLWNLKEQRERSETINASMKRSVGSQTPLSELIDQTFDANHVLTPYAFSRIQEEIISSFQYLTTRKDDGTYEVTHFSKKEKRRKVSLMVEDNVMNCSCKGFEFTCILCRHSLHVLFKENFIQIPYRYLPKRRRRSTSLISNVSSSTSAAYVERIQTIQSLASTIGTKDTRFDDYYKFIMEQFSRILEHVEEVECMRFPMVDERSNAKDENRLHYERIHVKNPVRSITKGQPPKKRLKPHIEVVKKSKYCKVPSCDQTGHDYKN
ncbi:hypothetical protein AMTRI_Chr06g173570 [Amborella trichopoda]